MGIGGIAFPISFLVSSVSLNEPFQASFTNTANVDVSFTIGGQNVTGLPAGTQMLGPNGTVTLPGLVATSSVASITVNVTSPSASSNTYDLMIAR